MLPRGHYATLTNDMLSAQLLAILRVYWRLARPEVWLFQGRDETKRIEVRVL